MNSNVTTDTLKSIVHSADLDLDNQLCSDILSICEYLDLQHCRISVFGPFNNGKSTLINALLGTRALPIDLIPTRAVAI